MSGPSIEERLQRLVGGFTAPATTTALDAIERRTQVLRRRRRVGVATGAGVLGVVVVVIAALALRHDPPPDEPSVDIDPVQPPEEGGLPAITLDLDGWEVTSATDEHDVPVGLPGLPADVEVPEGVLPDPGTPEAVQVFHPPGELMPSVYVKHTPVTGTIGQQMFDEPVTIRGVQGLASTEFEGEVAMTWNPHGGNTTVWLRARGLDFDQVVAFANGLEPRDADIASPPGADDRFGFEATVPLAGMEEDPLAAEAPATADQRIVTLSDGTNLVRITVDDAGQRAFYDYVTSVIADSWSSVTVLDRPATLFTRDVGYVPGGPLSIDQGGMAELNWLHTTTAKVKVEISTDDEDQVEAIIGGLRQISDEEWGDLVATAPPTTTTTAFVPP